MGCWTLGDIPWDQFDRERVNPDILAIVKAASVVEYNAGDYVTYLRHVFPDDARFIRAIEGWGQEEAQHGAALARWAELADPTFDFDASFAAFKQGFSLPLEADSSVRGSRTGELIARCMVETGTSSHYSALADATDEPVLKEICRRIAEDEFAHYALFHSHMRRYLEKEKLGFWRRLWIALGRIRESEDDELAIAYHVTNRIGGQYDRERAIRDYAARVMPCYRRDHVRRMTDMVFTAIGLKQNGRVSRALAYLITGLVSGFIRLRGRQAATA